MGNSIAEANWSGSQQESELTKFRQSEIAAMDMDAKVVRMLASSDPGYSEADYFDSHGKTDVDRYADTFGDGQAINTSDRLRLSSVSRNGTELGRLQAKELELISQNRQLLDEIEWKQQQAILAQSAAYSEKDVDRLVARYPARGSPPNGATGEAIPLGTLEGFFTFDKPGQILKGVGLGLKAPVDMVVGAGNLVDDAYGFAARAITGEPYPVQSGLVQSIQSQGLVATAGDLFANTVKSLPGIAQINSLYRNDMVGLGQSLPGLMGAAGGLKVFGRGVSRTVIGLDWTRVSARTGGNAAEHIALNHGMLSLTKPNQGVFYGTPVSTVDDAWAIARRSNLKPVSVGNRDFYIVPRPNSGYAGGMGGQLQNLDHVTIITELQRIARAFRES